MYALVNTRLIYNTPNFNTTRTRSANAMDFTLSSDTKGEFARVSQAQMEKLHEFFRCEPLLKFTTDMCIHHLLGGGVHFSRAGMKLDPDASLFYSTVWTDFVRALMTQFWVVGFAAVGVRQHAKYGGVPTVINLENVAVSFKCHVDGHNEYNLDLENIQCGPKDRKLLKRAVVFEWSPPRSNGDINSVVMRALIARTTLSDTLRACSLATYRASNPPIVTEMTNITAAGPIENMAMQPDVTGQRFGGGLSAMSPAELLSMREVKARSFMLNTRMGGNALDDSFGNEPFNRDQPLGSHGGGTFSTIKGMPQTVHVPLGPDRRLVHQVPPREPANLQFVQTSYERRVCALFGVPHSYFAGGMQQSRSITFSNEVWHSARRSRKQRVSSMLLEVFILVHGDTMIVDDIVTENQNQNSIQVGTSGEPSLSVALPGIPPREMIKDWFDSGILKYDAYIEHISNIYGVPLSDFNSSFDSTRQNKNPKTDISKSTEGAEPEDDQPHK